MDIRIEKSDRGYKVMLDGKLYRLYTGSQDVRKLYETIHRERRSVGRELERLEHGREWHDKIAAGTLPNSGLDAFVVILEAALRRYGRK